MRGLHHIVVLSLIGCGSGRLSSTPAETEADAGAIAEQCSGEPADEWLGDARRDNDTGYPDHLHVALSWHYAGTDGCVDRYTPSGTAHYEYAIPGALCTQELTPADHAIASGDGEMLVDRSTDPPTYRGSGATTWTVTHRCTYDDGRVDELELSGGAAWLDATGKVEAGEIVGSVNIGDDTERCGPEGIPPCTYAWSFTAL